MTFYANSMTFKIDDSKIDCMSRKDYDEFVRWYTENAVAMRPGDAAAGAQLIERMKEVLNNRDRFGKFYVDPGTSSDAGSQLSFFPAR